MRLLAGLGNPGVQYVRSRHNIGFVCIDAVLKALDLPADGRTFKGGELWETRLEGEKIAIFKPLQYMNRSGQPLREVMDYFDIATDDLCIAADEVYVAPGSIRIRRGGGNGGHNGWKSVLEHLEDDNFWRIRIGVGLYEQHPEKRMHQPALDEYVLQPIPPHDRDLAEKAIDNLVPNLIKWLRSGQMTEETIHL
ncbi:MAG: aminoacyl-tRNA hydrolase [Patescibacteria group bacterium]|jgi:PTH1 family peptidyl-tRNA hydrolase|nr:aminoacyl-tRNA hydrolase [Patescibacteria group bacterium]